MEQTQQWKIGKILKFLYNTTIQMSYSNRPIYYNNRPICSSWVATIAHAHELISHWINGINKVKREDAWWCQNKKIVIKKIELSILPQIFKLSKGKWGDSCSKFASRGVIRERERERENSLSLSLQESPPLMYRSWYD